MSTRSTLIVSINQEFGAGNVNNGIRQTQYYHHWDGYVEGVGKDLIFRLNNLIDGRSEFISGIMDIEHLFRDNVPASYVHESVENIHGDLEFLYLLIRPKGSKELTLFVYKLGEFFNSYDTYGDFILSAVGEELARWGWNEKHHFLKSINYKGNF